MTSSTSTSGLPRTIGRSMATPGFGGLNRQLYDAVERNDIVAATRLLNWGANINSRGGRFNRTVLIEACAKDNEALSMVKHLLGKGAAINETDINGNTALIEATSRENEKMVDLLLQKNADVDKEDNVGCTPLMLAGRRGYEKIVGLLLQKNADVDKKDICGRTAIHWAAIHDHSSIINRLGSCGATVDVDDDEGKTPLWWAVNEDHANCVDVILSFNANPQHRSKYEGSPLDVAEKKGHKELVKRMYDAVKSPQARPHTARLSHSATASVAPPQSQPQHTRVAKAPDVQMSIARQQVKHTVRKSDQLQADASPTRNDKDLVTRLMKQVEEKNRQIEQMEERLDTSEAATEEYRRMIRQSEEVLKIPSSDIKLTTKKLGRGSYGEVCIGYWQGCPVAVKMLYEELAKSQRYIELLQQEVFLGWKIHHPNIASVCGVTLELQEGKKTAWIVIELLQGSMAGVIEAPQHGAHPLTLREQVDMAVDSACGLNYLHSLSRLVLHGDIRPTNILITPVMRAKLGDLGAARFSDASLSVGPMSPEYTAPERLDGRRPQKCKETDIYSMGVTLCELFTGLLPNSQTRMDQIQRIQQRDVFLLSKHMVAQDHERRPTAAEAFDAIDRIRQSDNYKGCPPRRMVKGKADGEDFVTLTDRMW